MLNCGFLRRELFAWLVNKFDTTTLSIELHGKSFKLDPSIFSHVMGISDRGDTMYIDGAIPDIWRTKFSITNRGIKLLYLEGLLKNNKTGDDDFKVTFCLHMLGTVLAPAAGEYVDARYLNVLAHVGNIKGKNWARWCFDQLVISIEKFQSKSARYISGCVLFLEVSMNEYTPLAAPSDNSDKAKHEIPNDDVFHMVLKEIQQLRKEHADLKHKVDGLYETIIVNKDDEAIRLKEKVDILYGKINHPYDTKPKDTSDHKKEQHTPLPNFPSMETYVSPPTQRHIVEVSSKDSLVKSQYPMRKHSPTPSWENESVPTVKDCALDDDYLFGHNTIPRLIDEEKRTIIAKGYEDQPSSSMNVIKKTRTLKIRKPSRYKLSPYQSDHRLRKPSMFQYDPFHLSVSQNSLDAQIIEYVYSEDLPQSIFH
ncbi:hypothetical protein LWI28_010743 [Acer negundo]|uniref:Uncharacterized protein n=1 Tax=Acer negundo TaxID=4023 RepID=A0AAD5I9B6_ACENE|nr:hypothetical protein LWI28_010743 [Acer negundo]